MRVAAASLAFNVGAWVQKSRVATIKGEEVADGIRANEEDGECEVELVSTVAEALAGEEESENVGELFLVIAVVRDLDHGWAQRNDDADRTLFSSSLA